MAAQTGIIYNKSVDASLDLHNNQRNL